MLFTWDTKNLCIVFRQWHVTSTASLVFSLLLVVALTAGYEALRAASRRYEDSVNKRVSSLPSMSFLLSLVMPSPFSCQKYEKNVALVSPFQSAPIGTGGSMLRLLFFLP